MTISELISSVRGMNKEVNSDSRISDRFIYNEAVSIRNTLLKQEDNKNRLFKMNSLFQTLLKVPIIEISTVEACGVESDCTFRRTKDKLPGILETAGGFVIRSVSSLDGSETLIYTTQLSLARKLNIQDRHTQDEKFFFLRNDYMYFYGIEWDYVMIEAIFDDPDEVDNQNKCEPEEVVCQPFYERNFAMPDYLEKPLKDMLNESLLRYYHQLVEDVDYDKRPIR